MIQFPFSNSTVARMQQDEINRTITPPRRRLMWSVWGLLYLFTLLPLALNMTLARADLLLLIMAVVYGAQLVVGLRTTLLASELIARLLRMAGNWDLLALTGLDARQTVWGTWAAVMQRHIGLHLRVAGLRVGAVIGMAQYLHNAPLPGEVSGILLPGAFPFQIAHHPAFIYVGGLTTEIPATFPAISGLLLVIPLLIVFAVLEAALSAAVGVFLGVIFSEYETLRAVNGASIRVVLMIAAMTLLLISAQTNIDTLRDGRCIRPTICSSYPFNDPRRTEAYDSARVQLRIRETGQIALSPWVDGGVMVGAMWARPATDLYSRSPEFMARVGVSAGIAGLSIAFAGWLSLYLAQIGTVSRGMAPSGRD